MRHAVAIALFFAIWFGVWSAAWLAGVHLFRTENSSTLWSILRLRCWRARGASITGFSAAWLKVKNRAYERR